jgi:hypothetical protein
LPLPKAAADKLAAEKAAAAQAAAQGPVTVVGTDIYRPDGSDNDGIGCEGLKPFSVISLHSSQLRANEILYDKRFSRIPFMLSLGEDIQ